jgi:hypothetical protein
MVLGISDAASRPNVLLNYQNLEMIKSNKKPFHNYGKKRNFAP